MSELQILKGEFEEKLDLLLAPGIKAGFPSPAGDYLHESLDFNRDLIRHPEATFYGKVYGDSMEDHMAAELDGLHAWGAWNVRARSDVSGAYDVRRLHARPLAEGGYVGL